MPLRFYRRFRAGPFRMNLSKTGVSYSIGRKGAWLTMGHDRVRASVGIPGTGLGYYEQRRLPQIAAPSLVPSAPSWRPLGRIVVAIIVGAAAGVALGIVLH
jgi:hypothetical protein